MAIPLAVSRSSSGADDRLENRPKGRVSMDLGTSAGLRLVTGRPSSDEKAAIVGLFGFADRLRPIWDAAKRGDPFAWWWLVKVEEAIARADQAIDAETQAAREDLSSLDWLSFDVSPAGQAKRIELNFACPYAYRGAQLVSQADQMVIRLNICRQVGARSRSAAKHARRVCERAIRHVFASALGFWDFNLTLDLVREQGPIAIDAEIKMGKIPDAVLNKTRWPGLLEIAASDDSEDPSDG